MQVDMHLTQVSDTSAIRPHYLAALCASVVTWSVLALGFTWIVDPYGVSPLRLHIPGLTALKPKRVAIDRLIKPIEVWRDQPRTVFLGTSRVHQSLDPADVEGTRFAPAYNASVPAVTLSMNVSYLEHYLQLDPRLRVAIVELFQYNFMGTPQDRRRFGRREVFAQAVQLNASADALWDAIVTVGHNLSGRSPTYEIGPGGHFVYPAGHNPAGPFAGFAAGIWQITPKPPAKMQLHEPAFETFRTMNVTARTHGVELLWVVTPEHAYVDAYFEFADAWEIVAEWLTRLSAEATIFSFSQPNAWVYEPVSPEMKYWYDPFHFSRQMGAAILANLAGRRLHEQPANFMIQLTPEQVPGHIQSRREAIRRWAAENPSFIEALGREHTKWLSMNREGK
jgi:hypothetical protein